MNNENSLQTGVRYAKNVAVGYLVINALGPRAQVYLILAFFHAVLALLGAFGGTLVGLVITGGYSDPPTDNPEVVIILALVGAACLVALPIYNHSSSSKQAVVRAEARAAAKEALDARIWKEVSARIARESARDEAQAVVRAASGIAVEPPIELFRRS
jgi:hypothetical protein